MAEKLDLLIIGGGPAGLSAAIYAKRAELNMAVSIPDKYEMGQIADSANVDNYPGMPDISGFDLCMAFKKHALNSGAKFIESRVEKLDFLDKMWHASLKDSSHITAKTVIFAGGSRYRSLEIEGEEKFEGNGISYCAVCDGAFFKDKVTAVVGGGNSALDEALYLSNMCKAVYLIHRRDDFRGNSATLNKLKEKENVIIKTNAYIEKLMGEERLSGIVLNNGKKINLDGIFLAIGMMPDTKILKDTGTLDKNGYVIAGEDCITSADGLFVAGDARTKKLRQVVTAVADGAAAVSSVLEYIR